MNIDFVLAFGTFLRICTAMHMHRNIHIPVPCYSQRECDYAVHFVCRHPLDRCICWANLDGFSVWILNQKQIFPPLPCCESPSCLSCLLPPPAIIHRQSDDGRKHCFGFLSSLRVEPVWWIGATYTRVCVHLISDEFRTCCHLPDLPFWQIVLRLHSLYLSVSLLSVLCSVFKVSLISFTHHSPHSTSASLLHFLLSTASLPEWRLTEVGSILIYFTPLWIFSVSRAGFMHGCQISCVLIRGIVSLICWLTE